MQQTVLTAREKIVAGFYLIFTVLAFSSIEIMVSPVRNDMAPMLMNFWRFLIGTMTLLPFVMLTRFRQLLQLQRADLFYLAFLGCMNIFLSMGAHSLCIKYAKASTAAVLIAANPVATNFFAWLLLREEMSLKRIFSLLLGLAGVALIAVRADSSVDTPLGIASGIVAMVGFGLYTVLSKRQLQKHGSLVVLVMSCLPALILYLPILYFFRAGFWPPSHTWPNLVGSGVIGTGLGYLTFMKAMEYLSAGRTSYLFFFKPPVAMLLAWWFLGEKSSAAAIAGTMLIMTGILVETLRRGR